MFEGVPTNNFENREGEVGKQEVTEALRKNPEDLTLLNKFLDQEQAKVTDSEMGLALNVTLAEIYRDAGLVEIAREAFNDVAEQAFQEHNDELYNKLMDEADKLG